MEIQEKENEQKGSPRNSNRVRQCLEIHGYPSAIIQDEMQDKGASKEKTKNFRTGGSFLEIEE